MKPIGHKAYLKQIAAFARVLRTHDSSPASLVTIDRSPLYLIMHDEIRGHLESPCAHCECDEGSREGDAIPEEECVLFSIGIEWLRPVYPCRKTAEILAQQNRICAVVRALVGKYHVRLQLHELERLRGNDLTVAINSSLGRIWDAVLRHNPDAPPISQSVLLVM